MNGPLAAGALTMLATLTGCAGGQAGTISDTSGAPTVSAPGLARNSASAAKLGLASPCDLASADEVGAAMQQPVAARETFDGPFSPDRLCTWSTLASIPTKDSGNVTVLVRAAAAGASTLQAVLSHVGSSLASVDASLVPVAGQTDAVANRKYEYALAHGTLILTMVGRVESTDGPVPAILTAAMRKVTELIATRLPGSDADRS